MRISARPLPARAAALVSRIGYGIASGTAAARSRAAIRAPNARRRPPHRLNINFLPNAVYEPMACIRATLAAAASTGFPLQRLTFEVVESEELADAEHLCKIIETYRRIGFRIALDDFGSGYSGLARLADLRPDTIKIERAIVAGCDQDRTRRAILGNILNLGREIGVDVVLEGVERIEEVEALRTIGGRFMQGYYFGRPAFERVIPDSDICWPDWPTVASAAAAG